MVQILLYLICITSIDYVKPARILAVFPTPSLSPHHMFKALLQELVEHQHEITLVTANPTFTNNQITEEINTVDIYNKTSRIWQKYINTVTSADNLDVATEVDIAFQTTTSIFKEMLKTAEIKKLIEEKHTYFDLLLLEASVTPLLSFAHVFKAPVILVSPIGAVLGNYKTIGAPTHPFLYPSTFRRRSYNLTTWEKFTEMYGYLRLESRYMTSDKKVDLILKEHFGVEFPTLNELKRNVYALFLNNNPIWAGCHPVPPNVVFMGGVQPKNTEELPQDLQSFLNKSRNGVIYVSFGSNIKPSLFPPKKLLRILHTLEEVSYDVILKWDNDRLPGAPKNVKIYKWLPQSSLLGHHKIKLFITHGGLQSTFEAISAGVPLVGIPVYSDQWYNTERYEKFHIGLQLDMASLTVRKFMDAINVVTSDKSYRNSIIELRSLMFAYPKSSLQEAIWWTEQLSRPYSMQYLRSPAANISWTEYLELDFIFFILTILFTIVLVSTICLALIFKYLFKSLSDIKKKKS